MFKFSILIIVFLIPLSLSFAENDFSSKLVAAALERTQEQVTYDPTYFSISYPNGDIPKDKGVCTDVIIRSYRAVGIDLQKEVHEDMKENFSKYPKTWGLNKTDKNIDHRRVPNLQVFLKRKGQSLPISDKIADYKPGDLVTWNIAHAWKSKHSAIKTVPHIGIVTNQISTSTKRPLIVHNIGQGPKLEDVLFNFDVTGHYRYLPE